MKIFKRQQANTIEVYVCHEQLDEEWSLGTLLIYSPTNILIGIEPSRIWYTKQLEDWTQLEEYINAR